MAREVPTQTHYSIACGGGASPSPSHSIHAIILGIFLEAKLDGNNRQFNVASLP